MTKVEQSRKINQYYCPKSIQQKIWRLLNQQLTYKLWMILFLQISNNFIPNRPMKTTKQKSAKKNEDKQSSLTRKKLIQFLIRSAEVERKLQIVKEMLSEQQDFTPASLFHRIDTARKGYISQRDIESFAKDQGLNFKGSELKMLFGRMNEAKREDAVRLREFQNFILPRQNPRLRYFTTRRPVIVPVPNERLSQKVEWITGKFLSELVKQYSKLLQLHQALLSSFDFDAEQIFKLLSTNGQAITGEDIIAFMTDQNREISTQEVGCLLAAIDRKGEGQLFLNDFKYFLATLGLKREHEIFDELSPIPALKESQQAQIKKAVRDRDQTLKDRYKDNKSYVKGMDEQGHHILGYSKKSDSRSPEWLSNSRKARR